MLSQVTGIVHSQPQSEDLVIMQEFYNKKKIAFRPNLTKGIRRVES